MELCQQEVSTPDTWWYPHMRVGRWVSYQPWLLNLGILQIFCHCQYLSTGVARFADPLHAKHGSFDVAGISWLDQKQTLQAFPKIGAIVHPTSCVEICVGMDDMSF